MNDADINQFLEEIGDQVLEDEALEEWDAFEDDVWDDDWDLFVVKTQQAVEDLENEENDSG